MVELRVGGQRQLQADVLLPDLVAGGGDFSWGAFAQCRDQIGVSLPPQSVEVWWAQPLPKTFQVVGEQQQLRQVGRQDQRVSALQTSQRRYRAQLSGPAIRGVERIAAAAHPHIQR